MNNVTSFRGKVSSDQSVCLNEALKGYLISRFKVERFTELTFGDDRKQVKVTYTRPNTPEPIGNESGTLVYFAWCEGKDDFQMIQEAIDCWNEVKHV